MLAWPVGSWVGVLHSHSIPQPAVGRVCDYRCMFGIFIWIYKFAFATRTSLILHVSRPGSCDNWRESYTAGWPKCRDWAPNSDDVGQSGTFSWSLDGMHWYIAAPV